MIKTITMPSSLDYLRGETSVKNYGKRTSDRRLMDLDRLLNSNHSKHLNT